MIDFIQKQCIQSRRKSVSNVQQNYATVNRPVKSTQPTNPKSPVDFYRNAKTTRDVDPTRYNGNRRKFGKGIRHLKLVTLMWCFCEV